MKQEHTPMKINITPPARVSPVRPRLRDYDKTVTQTEHRDAASPGLTRLFKQGLATRYTKVNALLAPGQLDTIANSFVAKKGVGRKRAFAQLDARVRQAGG